MRDSELKALTARFAESCRGEAGLVLIHGPAGIGKSTLLRRFLATLDGQANLISVDGVESESALPYGVLTRVAGLLPADPFEAGARLRDWLEARQAAEPVVLAVDDAHWTDPASLAAFAFAWRRLRPARLLAVLTSRDADQPDALQPLLAHQTSVRLALGGIGPGQVRTLTHLPLTEQAARRLCDHTGGNPRHILQVLDEATPGDLADPHAPLPVPRGCARDTLARLERCGEPARLLVEAAAVLTVEAPPEARLGTTAGLAGVDEPLPALEEALAAGLLLERPTGAGIVVRFPGPLVRAAVYQQMGPTRRVRLHGSAAGLTSDEGARLGHLLRSAERPLPALVGEVAAAGRREAAAGRWGAAARLLSAAARLDAGHGAEAVEALVFDGRTAEARTLAGGLGGGDRWFALGVLAGFAGRTDEAAAAFGRVLTAARPEQAARPEDRVRTASHPEQAARPEDRVRATVRPELAARAGDHLDLGCGAGPAAYLRLMRNAPRPPRGGAGPDDRGGPARLLGTTAASLAAYGRGSWDEAAELGERSAALADELGQCWPSAHAHAVAALVPAARGEWREAALHVQAARRLAGDATAPVARTGPASAAAHLAMARNRPDEVAGLLSPLLVPLSSQPDLDGSGDGLPWVDLLAEALVTLGDPDGAERAGSGSPGVRARILAARHDVEAAREAFPAACAETAEPFDRARTLLAYGSFLRRLGRRKAAAEQLMQALRELAELRAAPYAQRCEIELAACGQRHAVSDLGLTPQQDAVARLVADGLTNRQIARELLLSVKTVEYHIGQVYARLGVSSRVALANGIRTRAGSLG